jgi:hypothetical protein
MSVNEVTAAVAPVVSIRTVTVGTWGTAPQAPPAPDWTYCNTIDLNTFCGVSVQPPQ